MRSPENPVKVTWEDSGWSKRILIEGTVSPFDGPIAEHTRTIGPFNIIIHEFEADYPIPEGDFSVHVEVLDHNVAIPLFKRNRLVRWEEALELSEEFIRFIKNPTAERALKALSK
jgi:hypothetical protein